MDSVVFKKEKIEFNALLAWIAYLNAKQGGWMEAGWSIGPHPLGVDMPEKGTQV